MTRSYHPSQLIKCLDYTSLNETDTVESITQFCHQAENKWGKVAAVCVYPQYVSLAESILRNTGIKIATVVNFPLGNESVENCYAAIKQAINSGASEIDAVIPYQLFLSGHHQVITEYVQAYREACAYPVLLKIILETGMYQHVDQIAHASELAINAGADFIKTSTGKVPQGASLQAATAILTTIKSYQSTFTQSISVSDKNSAIFFDKHPVGIKISGGISSIPQAEAYYHLAEDIMGANWVSPGTFRMGSSRLLAMLL